MNQPLAYVHPSAKIADNVVIEPFTTIHKNVVIEEGTWIGSNVTIMEGARIGKNVRIFPGAVISAIPQDLKFKGEETTAEVGDNTIIRECVTINRGTIDRGKTVIGKNCLVMAYSHIAHDCIVGDYCIFSNNSTLAGHITVGDHVILAGMTAVAEGVTTTRSVYELATHRDIDMPITSEIYQVLFENKSPEEATTSLMLRPPRGE